MRVGIGFDAHPFVAGRPLFVGGVEIPFDKGLSGHSDADVLLHAIIDALLGAASLGNIGQFFPENEEFKGISSLVLLARTFDLITKAGFKVVNLDSVVILEQPRLEKYWLQMKDNIAKALRIDTSQVSIKAKTTEKMGFTGRSEGIAAQAIVLLDKL